MNNKRLAPSDFVVDESGRLGEVIDSQSDDNVLVLFDGEHTETCKSKNLTKVCNSSNYLIAFKKDNDVSSHTVQTVAESLVKDDGHSLSKSQKNSVVSYFVNAMTIRAPLPLLYLDLRSCAIRREVYNALASLACLPELKAYNDEQLNHLVDVTVKHLIENYEGRFMTDTEITDEIKRVIAYFKYLDKWDEDHKDKGFAGMFACCYDEFVNCEFEDLDACEYYEILHLRPKD